MRITRETSPQYDKKLQLKVAQVRAIFSIRVINENQLEVLMIINKQLLMRMSRQSQANLKSRTQSTTIPNYASPNLLYIYKKGKCVESLTIPGSTLTVENRFAIVSTSINFQQAY